MNYIYWTYIIINSYFRISFNFIFKLKFHIYMHEKKYIIHKHSFTQIKFTCSLVFNEFLLQIKENIEI
jgi:hypothetical protein